MTRNAAIVGNCNSVTEQTSVSEKGDVAEKYMAAHRQGHGDNEFSGCVAQNTNNVACAFA